MILKGKYNTAKVFTDNIDSVTIGQIIELCNQEIFKESDIKVMPDCHAGKGCTIGTTMTIKDAIVSNLVGVDIGCGMTAYKIPGEIDLERLDKVIRKNVPHGFAINSKAHLKALKYFNVDLNNINAELINIERLYKSCGSLGGGNHFIELSKVDSMNILTIHTGSRNLGKQVAEYHQNKAIKNIRLDEKQRTKNIIDSLKKNGNEREISSAIQTNKKSVSNELCYLTGSNMIDYLKDMEIVQRFAQVNRLLIIASILNGYFYDDKKNIDDLAISIKSNTIESIHNYIDLKSMILRKGAISAKKGEPVIIPLNMADGIIFGKGKGNRDWNYSAPHGAGRILSRGKAKENIKLDDFKARMEGIYTTCIGQSTLDEAPQAYKPMNEIIECIGDTVDIEYIAKPIYNFKSN